MSNGWDEGVGTERFLCSAEGLPATSVFIGEFPWSGTSPSPTPPTVSLGAADFSIEFWFIRKYGRGISDFSYRTGFYNHTVAGGHAYCGIEWRCLIPPSFNHFPIFDETGNNDAARDILAQIPSPPFWSHYCLNIDRSANMERFIDNVLNGSVDITAQPGNIGSPNFYPLIGQAGALSDYQGSAVDGVLDTNIEVPPVVMGPIAVHTRLMTAAEREDSRKGKRVQNFGASTTKILYDWTVELETGWHEDLDNFEDAHVIGLPFMIAAPTGVSGTVRVKDKSGNENHYYPPVAAAYSSTTRPTVAFGLDKHFMG